MLPLPRTSLQVPVSEILAAIECQMLHSRVAQSHLVQQLQRNRFLLVLHRHGSRDVLLQANLISSQMPEDLLQTHLSLHRQHLPSILIG